MSNYDCKDCGINTVDFDDDYTLLVGEKDQEPGSYWLCVPCAKKRMRVFDKAVKNAFDPSCDYAELFDLFIEWDEEKEKEIKIKLTKKEKELAVEKKVLAVKSVFDRIKKKTDGPCLKLAVNAVNLYLTKEGK